MKVQFISVSFYKKSLPTYSCTYARIINGVWVREWMNDRVRANEWEMRFGKKLQGIYIVLYQAELLINLIK